MMCIVHPCTIPDHLIIWQVARQIQATPHLHQHLPLQNYSLYLPSASPVPLPIVFQALAFGDTMFFENAAPIAPPTYDQLLSISSLYLGDARESKAWLGRGAQQAQGWNLSLDR